MDTEKLNTELLAVGDKLRAKGWQAASINIYVGYLAIFDRPPGPLDPMISYRPSMVFINCYSCWNVHWIWFSYGVTMKLRIQAQHLQPGDIVGSGEVVIEIIINSTKWPSNKIYVELKGSNVRYVY